MFPLARPPPGAYVREVHDPFDPRRAPSRQPAFNIPGIIALLAGAMAAIQLVRSALSEAANVEILALFSFIPARYDRVPEFDLPGGLGAEIWSFVTYALLHGGWMHLGVNMVWMLAFASPVARRFGHARFLLFCGVTAIAGALAHLASYPSAMVPMIGASAVVSGAMAAAVRFAFAPGGPLGPPGRFRTDRQPAVSLIEAFKDKRVLVFVGVWVVLNVLFGVGISMPGTEGEEIAWQAHMGGFFAGLLLFSFFDPVPPASKDAAFRS